MKVQFFFIFLSVAGIFFITMNDSQLSVWIIYMYSSALVLFIFRKEWKRANKKIALLILIVVGILAYMISEYSVKLSFSSALELVFVFTALESVAIFLLCVNLSFSMRSKQVL